MQERDFMDDSFDRKKAITVSFDSALKVMSDLYMNTGISDTGRHTIFFVLTYFKEGFHLSVAVLAHVY
jgi:hypothetical protein